MLTDESRWLAILPHTKSTVAEVLMSCQLSGISEHTSTANAMAGSVRRDQIQPSGLFIETAAPSAVSLPTLLGPFSGPTIEPDQIVGAAPLTALSCTGPLPHTE